MPIAAIAVLLLNDHLLKQSIPGLVSGKLSDIAGMVFFPLLLQALVELVDRREPFQARRSVLLGCALLTGAVFGATNLFPWAAELYRVGLGALQWPIRALWASLSGHPCPGLAPVSHTLDPSDVFAIPFVGAAVAVGWGRTRARGVNQG